MTQTYKVQVSMNNAHIVESGFVWKQGDFGFNIEIEVLDFDTTGATPQIIFRKSTGAVEATEISRAENKFTYAIRGTELDTPGPCICDLKLNDSTTKRVSTASFKYFVIPDTMDGLNQQANSYSDTIEQIVGGFDDEIESINGELHNLYSDLLLAETRSASGSIIKEFKTAPGEVYIVTNNGSIPASVTVSNYNGQTTIESIGYLTGNQSKEWTVLTGGDYINAYFIGGGNCSIKLVKQNTIIDNIEDNITTMQGNISTLQTNVSTLQNNTTALNTQVGQTYYASFNKGTLDAAGSIIKAFKTTPGEVYFVKNNGSIPGSVAVTNYNGQTTIESIGYLTAGQSKEWTVATGGDYINAYFIGGGNCDVSVEKKGTTLFNVKNDVIALNTDVPVLQNDISVLKTQDNLTYISCSNKGTLGAAGSIIKAFKTTPGEVYFVKNNGSIPGSVAVTNYNGQTTIESIGYLTAGQSKEWTVATGGDYINAYIIAGGNCDFSLERKDTQVYKNKEAIEQISNVSSGTIKQDALPKYAKVQSSKKIVWFGTSIPCGAPNNNYPQMIGNMLGVTVYNEAVGSSRARAGKAEYIPYDSLYTPGTIYESMSRAMGYTMAEKNYFIDHWDDIKDNFTDPHPETLTDSDKNFMRECSFERKLYRYLDNKYNDYIAAGGADSAYKGNVDLYVFDHGTNDLNVDPNLNYNLVMPEKDSQYERYYFLGAMNFYIRTILENDPHAKIVIIGHYWKYTPQDDTIAMQQACASYWNIPIFKTWEELGWTNNVLTIDGQDVIYRDLILPDHIHPHSDTTGKANAKYARTLLPFIRDKILT